MLDPFSHSSQPAGRLCCHSLLSLLSLGQLLSPGVSCSVPCPHQRLVSLGVLGLLVNAIAFCAPLDPLPCCVLSLLCPCSCFPLCTWPSALRASTHTHTQCRQGFMYERGISHPSIAKCTLPHPGLPISPPIEDLWGSRYRKSAHPSSRRLCDFSVPFCVQFSVTAKYSCLCQSADSLVHCHMHSHSTGLDCLPPFTRTGASHLECCPRCFQCSL